MPLEKLGPYKIERLLGRGGMGAVYIGRREETGERAAIKLLAGHLAEDRNFRERFKQEIETLKRLRHPNIVQLHGFGEEDGHLYYVMELIEGCSLHDELTAGRRFDWREVTRIGIDIAQALKHAHDRGIIHRDLKPANLLIDGQDHVKLADFGIAKLYGGTSVTAEGGMLGTADYMAPEQASGSAVTSRCDLYSLGSVLYALLTGQPPFAAPTMIEVIAALQNDAPTPVRQANPEIPEQLDEIILQLLEKDPPKRIPTALALANRLRAMEHGLSLDTRVMDAAEVLEEAECAIDINPHLATSPKKTLPIQFGSQPTEPLKPSDPARDAPPVSGATVHTHAGIARAVGRTALGTQAGKPTGGVIRSSEGTDVEPSVLRESGAVESPIEKVSRFTTVPAADLRGSSSGEEASKQPWLLAGGLALAGLAIVSAVAFFSTRPPSADRLYEAVKSAADSGEPADLVGVEGEIARFLELYPDDHRRDEMKSLEADIEQYRLQQRLRPRGRLGWSGKAATPIERAYQEAVRLIDSDPAAALVQFEAIAAVFGGDVDSTESEQSKKTTAQCLQLARQQIEAIRPQVDKLVAEELKFIQRQMDRAEQLVGSDPEAARKIYRGIVTLYADKPWARHVVEGCRGKLRPAEPDADPGRS